MKLWDGEKQQEQEQEQLAIPSADSETEGAHEQKLEPHSIDESEPSSSRNLDVSTPSRQGPKDLSEEESVAAMAALHVDSRKKSTSRSYMPSWASKLRPGKDKTSNAMLGPRVIATATRQPAPKSIATIATESSLTGSFCDKSADFRKPLKPSWS